MMSVGCAHRIIVPVSDTTPPVIRMIVYGLGDPIELKAGDPNVSRSVPMEGEFVLVAEAKDADGGVKNVWIDGDVEVSCRGQSMDIVYVASNPENSNVGIGGTALDLRGTNLDISVNRLENRCQSGAPFQSTSGSFRASAENFHSGTSTTAEFRFSSP